MTQERLKEILDNHRKFLNNEDGGAGTNLIGANLRYATLMNADLRFANFSYANLRYADLSDANLRYADLSDTDLRGADLSNTDLRYATGNNKEVKSLQLGKYHTTILVGIKICIGCQDHTIEQWENFTDEEISKMDNGALDWWKKWKEFILKVAKENK